MQNTQHNTHLIGMLLHLHHILHDAYSEILEPYGLVPRQFGVLITGLHTPLSQTKLAQFLLMDKNIVGMMIDSLENKGLIRRQQNPKNRRENLIIITERGKELALEIESKVLIAQRACLKALSDEEFASLCACMTKINTIFCKEQ